MCRIVVNDQVNGLSLLNGAMLVEVLEELPDVDASHGTARSHDLSQRSRRQTMMLFRDECNHALGALGCQDPLAIQAEPAPRLGTGFFRQLRRQEPCPRD